jgi:hypothetical protein
MMFKFRREYYLIIGAFRVMQLKWECLWPEPEVLISQKIRLFINHPSAEASVFVSPVSCTLSSSPPLWKDGISENFSYSDGGGVWWVGGFLGFKAQSTVSVGYIVQYLLISEAHTITGKPKHEPLFIRKCYVYTAELCRIVLIFSWTHQFGLTYFAKAKA